MEEKLLQLLPSFLATGNQLAGFLQEGKALLAGWKGKEDTAPESLLHSLTQGVHAIETYKKQKHPYHLSNHG